MSRFCRHLGGAEVHQGHGGIHRHRRRLARPGEDRHARRFHDAARRPQHPPHATASSTWRPACTTTSATPWWPSSAPTASTASSRPAAPTPRIGIDHRRQELSRRPPGAGRPRHRRGEGQRHRPAASSRSAAPGRSSPVGLMDFVQRARPHHRRRGEALAHRGAGARGALRHAGPARLHRQEGRARQLALPGQGRARPQRHRHRHRRAAAEATRESEELRGRRQPAEAGAGRRWPRRRTSPPASPTFCSGCPHNTSTKVPEGMRAYAGIGCHYMVQWMDRSTDGFTQMGGEGANWIGEAPFSKRGHVFQNLGDGTYNHSGVLALRFAIASQGEHHLQAAVQRRRGDDGRPAPRGRAHGRRARAAGRGRGREAHRARLRRAGQVSRRARIGRRASPSTTATSWTTAQRELRRDPRRHRRSSTTRPAPPRSAAAASGASSRIPTSASSSTRSSARAAAIAACSPTASPCSRSRPSSAASGRSTSRTATRTSPASRASARPSSPCEGATIRKAAPAAEAAAEAGPRTAGAICPSPACPCDHAALRHHRHRRRRHGRRHHRRDPRHGGPSGGQGLRHDRHGRPRPEGRRGLQPCQARAAARRTSTPSASRPARRT